MKVTVEDETDLKIVTKLKDSLDENDDVQNVFDNIEEK